MTLTQTDPEDLKAAIAEIVRNVAGIRMTPDNVPDQLAAWPAAVVYFSKGHYRTGDYGIAESVHTVVVDVLYPRKGLAQAIEKIDPFIKSIPAALTDGLNPWFTDLAEPFDGISYELVTTTYNDVEVIGYKFVIENIKLYPYGKQ